MTSVSSSVPTTAAATTSNDADTVIDASINKRQRKEVLSDYFKLMPTCDMGNGLSIIVCIKFIQFNVTVPLKRKRTHVAMFESAKEAVTMMELGSVPDVKKPDFYCEDEATANYLEEHALYSDVNYAIQLALENAETRRMIVWHNLANPCTLWSSTNKQKVFISVRAEIPVWVSKDIARFVDDERDRRRVEAKQKKYAEILRPLSNEDTIVVLGGANHSLLPYAPAGTREIDIEVKLTVTGFHNTFTSPRIMAGCIIPSSVVIDPHRIIKFNVVSIDSPKFLDLGIAAHIHRAYKAQTPSAARLREKARGELGGGYRADDRGPGIRTGKGKARIPLKAYVPSDVEDRLRRLMVA